jgi:transcription elongation factor Elf1
MARVTCQECEKRFEPAAVQQKLVDEARAKGMHLIMLQCPNCGMSAAYDPTTGQPAADDDAPGLRCPVSGCAGIVSHVEDLEDKRPFWGCGECGSIWYDERKLQAEPFVRGSTVS